LRRLIALIAVVVASLAFATSAEAFVAKLKAPTHTPKAGAPWPIKVSAHTKKGKKLHASAYYAFLHSGQVVQICKPLPNKPAGRVCTSDPTPPNIGVFRYKFFGSYRDVVIWPNEAIFAGTLVFRVVVHVRHGGTKQLDYPVNVHG